MLHILDRFNQYAVSLHLSAGAILLWQRLYFSMSRSGQFTDVPQNTSVLTALLQVTRQGLYSMRQSLIDNGLLAVRQDEHQQIFYTLLLNGKEISIPNDGETREVPASAPHAGAFAKRDVQGPSSAGTGNFHIHPDNANGIPAGAFAHRYPDNTSDAPVKAFSADTIFSTEGHPKNANVTPAGDGLARFSAPNRDVPKKEPVGDGALDVPLMSGDIILNNACRSYIDQFCSRFGPAMKPELLQWADMRRQNGWTLTLWGLEEMLKKLIDLAQGNAITMGQIVAQSVKRRWKGFFPLKAASKPSGKALLKQEAAARPAVVRQTSRPFSQSRVQPKFQPEGRDLNYLMR